MKPWEEPPEYEPMIYRAKLINQIDVWYKEKFKYKTGYEKVSVYDLIADFIMESRSPIKSSLTPYSLREASAYEAGYDAAMEEIQAFNKHDLIQPKKGTKCESPS